MNERGIWTTKEETDTHEFDVSLCDQIVLLFHGSVIDIGCGDGSYTRHLIQNGFDCVGYDGSPLTPELSSGLCGVMDFSEPVNVGRFDIVLSLEIGEHIPIQYEEVFIDNICNATKNFIILSWAVIGQGGTGHVNCRDNDYIITKIQARGFILNPALTQKLRSSAILSWFKNTLMVFQWKQ